MIDHFTPAYTWVPKGKHGVLGGGIGKGDAAGCGWKVGVVGCGWKVGVVGCGWKVGVVGCCWKVGVVGCGEAAFLATLPELAENVSSGRRSETVISRLSTHYG